MTCGRSLLELRGRFGFDDQGEGHRWRCSISSMTSGVDRDAVSARSDASRRVTARHGASRRDSARLGAADCSNISLGRCATGAARSMMIMSACPMIHSLKLEKGANGG